MKTKKPKTHKETYKVDPETSVVRLLLAMDKPGYKLVKIKIKRTLTKATAIYEKISNTI